MISRDPRQRPKPKKKTGNSLARLAVWMTDDQILKESTKRVCPGSHGKSLYDICSKRAIAPSLCALSPLGACARKEPAAGLESVSLFLL